MALGRTLLDTSAYSAFKRGHTETVDVVRRAPELLVSAVSLGELVGGFLGGGRADDNRRELDEFLRSPRVRAVPVSEATAERYAVSWLALRRAGRPVPTNDLWIAAAAMEHGAEVCTLDRDFLRIPGLLVRCFRP